MPRRKAGAKWGKVGAPHSAQRRAWLARIRPKARRARGTRTRRRTRR